MIKKIKFLDLSIQKKNDKKIYKEEFEKFINKGIYILGKDVKKFERNISKKTNNKYSIGVSSGTNAIYLALIALGIKKGDQVIVPCLSWYSTFTAVAMMGAIPIGVDIGNDLLLNEELINSKINKKTKAIIFVHFTGLVKDLSNLYKICKKKKIFLIEDCAQSFGSKIDNKMSGSFGDVATFSMNPMKVLGAIGDAGVVSTSNKKIYNKSLILRYAGVDMSKDKCIYPNLNHKIDTLQAQILNIKLKSINSVIKKRISNAEFYEKNLTKNVIKPIFRNNYEHIYYTYIIRCKKRNILKNYLEKKGIETKVQHHNLVYDHPGLKRFDVFKDKFPNARKLTREILCLPIRESLKISEIDYICTTVNSFYRSKI